MSYIKSAYITATCIFWVLYVVSICMGMFGTATVHDELPTHGDNDMVVKPKIDVVMKQTSNLEQGSLW